MDAFTRLLSSLTWIMERPHQLFLMSVYSSDHLFVFQLGLPFCRFSS